MNKFRELRMPEDKDHVIAKGDEVKWKGSSALWWDKADGSTGLTFGQVQSDDHVNPLEVRTPVL